MKKAFLVKPIKKGCVEIETNLKLIDFESNKDTGYEGKVVGRLDLDLIRDKGLDEAFNMFIDKMKLNIYKGIKDWIK